MKTVFSLFVFFAVAQATFAQALLVGVSNDGTFGQLKYAPNDVAKVEKVLRDHGYRVSTMLDTTHRDKPTRPNILSRWEDVCSNTRIDETAIFYGSLHGTDIDGTAYIVPVGGNIDHPGKTMICFNELLDIAAKHQVKNCLVVLDCCRDKADTERIIRFKGLSRQQTIHTKSLAPISTQSIDAIVAEMQQNAKMPQNYSVIFACGQGQRSVEDSALSGSVFTHFFVKAFSEKEAANGTGTLTANSIFDYVSPRVKSYTKSIKGMNVEQVPEIIGRYSSGPMTLGKLNLQTETIVAVKPQQRAPSTRQAPPQVQQTYPRRPSTGERPIVTIAKSPVGQAAIRYGLSQIRF